MKKLFKFPIVGILATTLLVLGGCSEESTGAEETEQEPTETVAMEAGTYSVEVEGHNGLVNVDVTLTEDKIESVDILEHEETAWVGENALKFMPQKIVEQQSTSVDTVAGATVTSYAVLSAVNNAIEEAGGTKEHFDVSPADQTGESEEISTDLLVIGAGPAGLNAATRAEELGYDVTLLEKNDFIGGALSVSGGGQVVLGSKLQIDEGIEDDPSVMVEDFMDNGDNLNVEELVQLYAENVGHTTDWLIDHIGIEYGEGLSAVAEYSNDRLVWFEGGAPQFSQTYSDFLETTDVKTFFGTRATELIYEDGQVTGAHAENKFGKTYEITADAVVIATGGYGNNSDLLSDELNDVLFYGARHATGDGILMAEDINAETFLMDQGKIYPNGIEVSPGYAKSTVMGNTVVFDQNAILVNTNGERVGNEKASHADVTEALLGLEDQTMYLVMDSTSFEDFREGIKVGGISDFEVDQWLENNGVQTPHFIQGDSIAEVAEIAGIDPEALESTIEEYNSFVEAGEDTEFGRPAESMASTLGEGTIYLVEQKPRFATTLGGLTVNTDLQVLNNDGEIIGGLYAAGETVGGVMGSDSPPGANNGWALTSGKLAAEAIDANNVAE